MEKNYRELCILHGRIGRMRHRIIESRIAGLGIHPSQHLLLMHLSDMGRFSSQAQIAEKMHVSPASVARTLKSLEAGGYIQRFDSDADGRRNEIAITEKGEDVVRQSRELFACIDSHQYAGFTAEEMELLLRLAERQVGNLQLLDQTDKDWNREEMKSR